jgi:hypothetical protein
MRNIGLFRERNINYSIQIGFLHFVARYFDGDIAPNAAIKSEYRISKFETISNNQNINDPNRTMS